MDLNLKFDGYNGTKPRTVTLLNRAIIGFNNFSFEFRIVASEAPDLGETGSADFGNFMVTDVSYINPEVKHITVKTIPKEVDINKLTVYGQNKSIPKDDYNRYYVLPDLPTKQVIKHLEGIPNDAFSPHLMLATTLAKDKVSTLLNARATYVDSMAALLQTVTTGEDGTLDKMLDLEKAYETLVSTMKAMRKDEYFSLSGGEIKSGYSDAGQLGPRVNTIIALSDLNVPMSQSKALRLLNDIGKVYATIDNFSTGYARKKQYIAKIHLSDWEYMANVCHVQVANLEWDVDLSVLQAPIDGIDFDTSVPGKGVDLVLFFTVWDEIGNPDGVTKIELRYRNDQNWFDSAISFPDRGNTLDYSAGLQEIPHMPISPGTDDFIDSVLATVSAPFDNQSIPSMLIGMLTVLISDILSFSNLDIVNDPKGITKISGDELKSIIGAVAGIITAFAVNPIAGTMIGGTLITSFLQANFAPTRRATLNAIAGDVMGKFGAAYIKPYNLGSYPDFAGGVYQGASGIVDINYADNQEDPGLFNQGYPRYTTQVPQTGSINKWLGKPQPLRTPKFYGNPSEYPHPFSVYDVNAVNLTSDPNVARALAYLQTGEL